jgi:hypothetical protein
VQREQSGPGILSTAPSMVRDVVASPGRPLDAATRASMEPRFGHDLSQVRVHTDDQAAESARSVSASAYTAGNHVAFGAGQYAPGTLGGHRLMAHELTHVIQQSSGPVAGTQVAPGFFVSHPADPFERLAASPIAVDAPAQRGVGLERLPFAGHGSRATYVQRTDQPNVGLGNAGAAFGIIGGVAGVLGLGLAAFAYFRPPEALNPAPVTGGLSINPNPFSFNTVAQTPALPQVLPAKEPRSHREEFSKAQKGPPTIHPLIDLRTDDSNHAVINLAERHDGLNIVDASIRTGTMENYLGGSRGSSATVNFSATQTSPAPTGLFEDAPKDAPAEAVEPAEVMVSFTGSNAKDQGAPQNFAGSFTVSGKDGGVNMADPEVTNGVGQARQQTNMAFIDLRSPAVGAPSVGESLGSSSGGGTGVGIPRFDVPNPPILDRP